MNKNIKAGADINAGDGGYSIGTKEKYDEFVKIRNRSLAEARIRELAEQAGLNYHNWMTNESNINDGDFKYPRLEDYKKFAELLIRECEKILIEKVEVALDASGNPVSPEDFIKEHFGVEERKDLMCPKCGVDRTLIDELQIECDRLYRIIELNGILK